MQLVVNRPFVRRKERIGKIGMILGFVGFFIGLAFVLQAGPQASTVTYIGAYAGAILGLVAFNVGSYHYQLWSRKPTPLDTILGALKGMHKKSTLFSYLPHLPAEHVLLTPGGVFVLLVKHVDGKVSGTNEHWKHVPERRFAALLNPFSQVRLGSPAKEARAAEAAVQQILAKALGTGADDVPVESVVLFTNPLVQVDLQDPSVPVVVPDQLHGYVAQRSRGRLSPGQLDKLADVLKADFEPEQNGKGRTKARRGRGRR
ncbi:MAG: nuclease-related domain-containing protein [Chloroflexota bacterium]